MDTGTLAAFVSSFLIGGVGLGWVASANWRQSLTNPPEWRSLSYLYGCSIILLCQYVTTWFTPGGRLTLAQVAIPVAVCGLWTMGTHALHARENRADARAAAHLEGEGDAE